MSDLNKLKQELTEELDHIKAKALELCDFMHSDEYADQAPVDQGLMMVQMRFMDGYAAALVDRLNHVTEKMVSESD